MVLSSLVSTVLTAMLFCLFLFDLLPPKKPELSLKPSQALPCRKMPGPESNRLVRLSSTFQFGLGTAKIGALFQF